MHAPMEKWGKDNEPFTLILFMLDLSFALYLLISSTLNEQLFSTSFLSNFLLIVWAFVIFWLKIICAKAARKMLLLLIQGVNFTIICVNFYYHWCKAQMYKHLAEKMPFSFTNRIAHKPTQAQRHKLCPTFHCMYCMSKNVGENQCS